MHACVYAPLYRFCFELHEMHPNTSFILPIHFGTCILFYSLSIALLNFTELIRLIYTIYGITCHKNSAFALTALNAPLSKLNGKRCSEKCVQFSICITEHTVCDKMSTIASRRHRHHQLRH